MASYININNLSSFCGTPQKHQILIDGGPDDTVIEKLGKEMPFWDRTIDLIALTHPEEDQQKVWTNILGSICGRGREKLLKEQFFDRMKA